MCLGLQRDDALNVFHAEKVAGALVGRGKLFHNRTLGKGDIIFVSRQYLVGILLRGLLNHGEERTLHLLTVNDKGASEDFVAAVFGINLCKTEYLGIGQRTAILLFYLVQVLYLFRRECQTFLFVIFLQIVHILDRLRLDIDGEDILIQSVVHALKHGVMLGIW